MRRRYGVFELFFDMEQAHIKAAGYNQGKSGLPLCGKGHCTP